MQYFTFLIALLNQVCFSTVQQSAFFARRSSRRCEFLLGSDCCNGRLQKVMTQTNRDAAGFYDELSQP